MNTPNADDYKDLSRWHDLEPNEMNNAALDMITEEICFIKEGRKPFTAHNSFAVIQGGKGGF